jgi:DNA polymerase-3 subunit beta
MKIECIKEKLTKAVAQAERVTTKNPTLPILGCILFEASKNNLTIKATNLDLGIEIHIPVKVIKDGVMAVPGAVLNNFLSTIQNDKNVTIESSENNTAKITASKTSTVIKTLPHDDFPEIPKVSEEQSFKIQGNDLVKGLKSVWYSSSVSSVKPELSSVFIHSDNDSLVFAATDSFRLAEKKVRIKKEKQIERILIPFKNIPEIIRTIDETKDEILVCFTKNQISFLHDELYLTSRVVDGMFPDYKQIIPNGNMTEVIVLKQDLIQALKTANIFSDKFNQINIQVSPKTKIFMLKTSNSDVGESNNSIDATLTGEDVAVNFNYKYLSDCFQSIDADSVSLSFNGLNKPLVIRGVNDKSFLYLVMPMNK